MQPLRVPADRVGVPAEVHRTPQRHVDVVEQGVSGDIRRRARGVLTDRRNRRHPGRLVDHRVVHRAERHRPRHEDDREPADGRDAPQDDAELAKVHAAACHEPAQRHGDTDRQREDERGLPEHNLEGRHDLVDNHEERVLAEPEPLRQDDDSDRELHGAEGDVRAAVRSAFFRHRLPGHAGGSADVPGERADHGVLAARVVQVGIPAGEPVAGKHAVGGGFAERDDVVERLSGEFHLRGVAAGVREDAAAGAGVGVVEGVAGPLRGLLGRRRGRRCRCGSRRGRRLRGSRGRISWSRRGRRLLVLLHEAGARAGERVRVRRRGRHGHGRSHQPHRAHQHREERHHDASCPHHRGP